MHLIICDQTGYNAACVLVHLCSEGEGEGGRKGRVGSEGKREGEEGVRYGGRGERRE